jgi:hypothetical protein
MFQRSCQVCPITCETSWFKKDCLNQNTSSLFRSKTKYSSSPDSELFKSTHSTLLRAKNRQRINVWNINNSRLLVHVAVLLKNLSYKMQIVNA